MYLIFYSVKCFAKLPDSVLRVETERIAGSRMEDWMRLFFIILLNL